MLTKVIDPPEDDEGTGGAGTGGQNQSNQATGGQGGYGSTSASGSQAMYQNAPQYSNYQQGNQHVAAGPSAPYSGGSRVSPSSS